MFQLFALFLATVVTYLGGCLNVPKPSLMRPCHHRYHTNPPTDHVAQCYAFSSCYPLIDQFRDKALSLMRRKLRILGVKSISEPNVYRQPISIAPKA